jgi:uncharacterized protein YciI
MSHFIIQALDYTDDDAQNRRLAVRELHLTRMKEEKEKGIFITGGAIINDEKNMIGSVIILSLPDKQSVAGWVQEDPYVKNRVWNEIHIAPFKLADV